MRFQISRARFLNALSLAQTVASKQKSMPVLANVMLRARKEGYLDIVSTDLMLGLVESFEVEVEKPGSLLVDAKQLASVVKSLAGGDLRFRGLDNHWAEIVSGKSSFKVMGMPETDFPDLPTPERGLKGKPVVFSKVRGSELSDLIQKTEFSVSTDEARVNLNGVLLESDGTTATMVSTDGHRLTKYARPLDGLTLDKGIIIPLKGMREIRRVLDRVLGEVQLGIGDQCLFLRAGELTLSVRLNDVTFPPYNQVIPPGHECEVHVDRSDLMGALRRCEVMAPAKTAAIRMKVDNGKLEFTADNPDIGVAHQEVDAEVKGPGLEAGFNARYLMAALEVIGSEDVRLQFQKALDPCVIKPVDDSDFISVVMPMRV